MTLQEMRDRRVKAITEAKALSELDNATEDQSKQFDTLMAEADGLKVKIDRKDRAAVALADLDAPESRITTATLGGGGHEIVTSNPNGRIRIEEIGSHVPITLVRDGSLRERRERLHRMGMALKAQHGRANGMPNLKAQEWCKEHGVQYGAVMSSVDNTAGGVFIADEFSASVIDLAEEYGTFAANADVAPMQSDTIMWPRITAGLTAYFAAESIQFTASQLATDLVQITAQSIGTFTLIPRELLDDSAINLAEIVGRKSALAIATKTDQCGYIGDGTSTYGGITGVAVKINDGNHAGGIYTALAGHTGFATLTIPDFTGTVGALRMFPGMQPKWYISNVGYWNSMVPLMVAAGGTVPQDIAGGPPPTFLGYPVIRTTTGLLNTTLGADVSKIKCLFGDLRMAATYGSRRQFGMEVSTERYIELRQALYMGWSRFGINVHDVGDGSNSGPIVALKTPGS